MIAWLRQKFIRKTDQPQYVYADDGNQEVGDDGATADEVFFNAASRFLDVQISTNDVFDNRTSNAFSIGSTVLPVTFGLLRLSAVTIPTITIVLLTAALVVYVALLFCVWRASRLRELQYRPNMLTLEGNSEVAAGPVLRRWVASEYVVSTELNRSLLQSKGVWVGRAVTALYAEGLFLSAAAIATLV